MIVCEVLVWLCGGFWRLKSRICASRWRIARRLLLLIYNWHQLYRGAGISASARFASDPLLPHGVAGVFVSGEAVIGRNCIIFQQVTIGSNSLLDSRGFGAPAVGDNCLIGAGAKIIGRVRIGNNVRIGANAVVVQDVPDNCVVVSGQQRNCQRERLENRLYSWRGAWEYFLAGQWQAERDPTAIARLEAEFSSSRRGSSESDGRGGVAQREC